MSIRFAPVINTQYTDEIGRFQAEKDPPLTDPQAHFAGPAFEGLDVTVACGSVSHQCRINPCLDDVIQARAKSRTAAGRNTTRRITPGTGGGLPP
ncbi:MAG: hypothetical protein ABSG03_25620 [Bryobacteraceae bacterium]|jgi:hypothetical protein